MTTLGQDMTTLGLDMTTLGLDNTALGRRLSTCAVTAVKSGQIYDGQGIAPRGSSLGFRLPEAGDAIIWKYVSIFNNIPL